MGKRSVCRRFCLYHCRLCLDIRRACSNADYCIGARRYGPVIGYLGCYIFPMGDQMTPIEILSIAVTAIVTIVVGGYWGGLKAREEINKLASERKVVEQKEITERVEREQRLNEIIEKQDTKISSLSNLVESLEKDIRAAKELIVTMEGQLRERNELIEDFRDYVGKLVILMRAAKLDVPEFLPRKGQK